MQILPTAAYHADESRSVVRAKPHYAQPGRTALKQTIANRPGARELASRAFPAKRPTSALGKRQLSDGYHLAR
jgi:hypothetical protein